MTTLEIAITDLAGAISAEQGGADSIELSIELNRDGLTPPLALVHAVREAVSIDLHVIIRPHDRDFIYTLEEISLILAQTSDLITTGINGIVFGAHHIDGTLNVDLVRRVRETAPDLAFTLHRALDSCTNPQESLAALENYIDRALTSGPAKSAWEGRAGLREWVQAHGDKINFIAAGSVNLAQLPALITETGAHGIHCGSGATINGIVNAEQVRYLKHAIA